MEAIIYLLCAYLLIKKEAMKKREDPGYMINKVYIIAFYAWFFYMVLDTIIPIIAPLSYNGEVNVSFLIGYDLQYPSLFIANVLRDIQLICAFIMIIFTYGATQIIKFGEEIGIKKFKRKKILVFFTIATILCLIFDSIEISYNQTLKILTVTNSWELLGPLGWIGFLLYLGLMTYNSMIIFTEYNKNKDILNKWERRKLFYFALGYSLLLAGLYYWIIVPLFGVLFAFNFEKILFNVLGYLIWSLAPLAFYQALKMQKQGKNEEKRSETVSSIENI